jgi:REP element-mobilizing transposase RayT
MPDHLHALLVFPQGRGMSGTVGDWKGYMARTIGIRWQENYFDHRLRTSAEAAEKWSYIGRNPVVKNLVQREEDWPWRWSGVTEGVVGQTP